MRILVRERADNDLDAIFAWIAKDNPGAAAAMIRRIRARIGKLAIPGLENMGRPGLDPGTRELIEPPYIIVYEVHEVRNEIQILYVVHGAQER
jgi:toxin ParE1/3/4